MNISHPADLRTLRQTSTSTLTIKDTYALLDPHGNYTRHAIERITVDLDGDLELLLGGISRTVWAIKGDPIWVTIR